MCLRVEFKGQEILVMKELQGKPLGQSPTTQFSLNYLLKCPGCHKLGVIRGYGDLGAKVFSKKKLNDTPLKS